MAGHSSAAGPARSLPPPRRFRCPVGGAGGRESLPPLCPRAKLLCPSPPPPSPAPRPPPARSRPLTAPPPASLCVTHRQRQPRARPAEPETASAPQRPPRAANARAPHAAGRGPAPPRDEQAYSPMSGGRAAEWAGIWAWPVLWVRRGAGAGPGRPPQPRVGRCGGRSAPAAVALLSPLLSPAMFLLVHNQHREQACEASPYTPGRAIPTLLLPCRPRSTFPRRCVNSRHK